MNTYSISQKIPLSTNDESFFPPYVLAFRDVPNDMRPREKLLREGPTSLSLPELLAVMLTTGTKREDIMAMCNRILKQYGEKSISGERDSKRLSKDLKIPLIKATQIVASVEFGKRLFETSPSRAKTLHTARDVFEYTKNMRDLPREHLRGIYLNQHSKIIHDEVVSIGTVDAHLIHPREVWKPAIDYGAVALILVHNHPSGNLKPSKADLEITEQLSAVGRILGIELVDHVIVASKGFTSIMHPPTS